MNELIAIIAIVAAATGAILSTLKGYWNSPDTESYKKGRLASSLIISIMTSFALVNFDIISDQLTSLGYVGIIVTYALIGFGTDAGLSQLDK